MAQEKITAEKEAEIEEHRKQKDDQISKMAKIMKKTIERMPAEVRFNF